MGTVRQFDKTTYCNKNYVIEKVKIGKYIIPIGVINKKNINRYIKKCKRIKDIELELSNRDGKGIVLFIKTREPSKLDFYSSDSGWISFKNIYKVHEIYKSNCISNLECSPMCNYYIYNKEDLNGFTCYTNKDYYEIHIDCRYNFCETQIYLSDMLENHHFIWNNIACAVADIRGSLYRYLRIICRKANYLSFIEDLYDKRDKRLQYKIAILTDRNKQNTFRFILARRTLEYRENRGKLSEQFKVIRNAIKKEIELLWYNLCAILLGKLKLGRYKLDLLNPKTTLDLVGTLPYFYNTSNIILVEEITYNKKPIFEQDTFVLIKDHICLIEIDLESKALEIVLNNGIIINSQEIIQKYLIQSLIDGFKGSFQLDDRYSICIDCNSVENKYVILIRKDMCVGIDRKDFLKM